MHAVACCHDGRMSVLGASLWNAGHAKRAGYPAVPPCQRFFTERPCNLSDQRGWCQPSAVKRALKRRHGGYAQSGQRFSTELSTGCLTSTARSITAEKPAVKKAVRRARQVHLRGKPVTSAFPPGCTNPIERFAVLAEKPPLRHHHGAWKLVHEVINKK
ncbi:hypothetical protein P1P91_01525 [Halomonas piscis]|uniref:Uncharacterized protein n=1 Tax=Halomonas piscis TaxID=3031727 RepID=A0ABY9YZU0_9GAMM|nr:hypothetical protein [Halomonas piscis]WNK20394.1 hypothetical protein P1P91_01525 [Halomonas piscis]